MAWEISGSLSKRLAVWYEERSLYPASMAAWCGALFRQALKLNPPTDGN